MISGYPELSQDEIALINEIKAQGEALVALVESLKHLERLDQRWEAIGKTDLQKGVMAPEIQELRADLDRLRVTVQELVRAVVRPTTF